MIVMKFGGTSVEDSAAITRVIEIIAREQRRTPLVVVSACAGVTGELLRVAATVRDGNRDKALNILDRLRARHRTIAEELISGQRAANTIETIDGIFQELRNLVRGVDLLGELTDRSLDTFAGFGELLSSRIVHAAMEERGMPAQLIDARTVMITDRNFGQAQPLFDLVTQRVCQTFHPPLAAGHIVITQGFIGSTEDGITTTIGRGGSDYSASIFGAMLGSEEIQIWTDVDGMMSADPRIVPHARPIQSMSFDEASELAYFGAKVLHPRTILPAVRKNIPVRILNSRRPELPGTLIAETHEAEQRPDAEDVVKSIACKRGIIVINISSSRMLMAHGFLAKLFTVFAEHQKSVDVVATSEVSVSLTVDSEDGLNEIENKLEAIGEVRITRRKAIICVVGGGMKNTPGIAARIFGALARAHVNIEMVSEGASEINLTLVVDEAAVELAVRTLHDEFFPSAPGMIRYEL
jgi:aspartate kinase